ncbi:phosphoribosylanthranilate isomerase [Xanthobacter autotrophicus]|uniref:phosphoribosylanthranilate isomerase n=1 Tax=Xanthobacter autotrophicus TaxID=280 RepID=UPI001E4C99A6|nr:phosphoribosylanthranilate isomerase [Xanthobacter autotrophicus]UDQ90585.1 phosphoribosylanthranilate isomerase [Xanthobacter autotrophicus]
MARDDRRFEVKICGIRTAEALDAALDAGADLVGFVHFPKSPRHLALADAPALVARVAGRAGKVALLVDPDDALLQDVIAAVSPDILQLHGHETPERVADIRARFGLPVMKALPVARREDLAVLPAYAAVADRILFDAKPDPGALLPGGNGRPFDWALVAGLDVNRPLMLSGGLTADNVPQALGLVRMDGVDVSSGVEDAPGVKSPDKIRAFVAAARSASPDRLPQASTPSQDSLSQDPLSQDLTSKARAS